MKKSRFTEKPIAYALHQAKVDIAIEEVYHKMGASQAIFYGVPSA